MGKSTNSMSLSDLLTAYGKACSPVSDEYIEKRTKEVFGDPEQLSNDLKTRIQAAVDNVLGESTLTAKKGA